MKTLRILFALTLMACNGTAVIEGQGGAGGSSSSSGSGASGGNGPNCESFVPCCDDASGEEVDWICIDGMPECPPGSSFASETGICGGQGGSCVSSSDCGPDAWCDFPDNRCGAGNPGTCKPRPDGCDLLYAPVCTCQGEVAGNTCDGQAGGYDVSAEGGCTPPLDTFACGELFCGAQGEYCRQDVSDVGGLPDAFACLPLPSSCSSSPDCACLAAEICGQWCEVLPGGELKLTCPGG